MAMKLALTLWLAFTSFSLVETFTALEAAAVLRGGEQRLAAFIAALPEEATDAVEGELASPPGVVPEVKGVKEQLRVGGIDRGTFWEAFSQALIVVFSAEMFDKTWFV